MLARTTFKNPTTNIPPLRFPQKLWKIANECKSGAVSWSPHGRSILLRYSLFKQEFLSPKNDFFKTDNISSFVRQLNLYGFRKIYDYALKQAYKANPDLHEFSNVSFQRDRPELLDQVTRKPGILKDRNDFSTDSQLSLDAYPDEEKRCDGGENAEFFDENEPPPCEENEEKVLQLPPQPPEETVVREIPNPPKIEEPVKVEPIQPILVPVKKKRGRKPGSKTDPNRPKQPRKSKKKNGGKSFAALKCPQMFPNLMFFTDDDTHHPFLRNTGPDVMLSSTISFEESPEYKGLRETYQRMQEQRMRARYAALPLTALYQNKANSDIVQILTNVRI